MKNVLIHIGAALLSVQSTESVLRLCMTYVIQKQSVPLTIESLESIKENESDKTLGYFMQQVRYRSEIDDDFDGKLKTFLINRNKLVHHLVDSDCFDIFDVENLSEAHNFLSSIINDAEYIGNVFYGVCRLWEEQNGFSIAPDKRLPIEVDIRFKEIAKNTFFEGSTFKK